MDPAEKIIWASEADKLRLPFWDWSDKKLAQDGLPDIFTLENIAILGPGNTNDTVANPLCYYNIGPTPADWEDTEPTTKDPNWGYFKSWQRTYRWPMNDKVRPTEDYAALNKVFKEDDKDGSGYSSVKQLREKLGPTYLYPTYSPVLQYPPDTDWPTLWDRFSNTTVQSARKENKIVKYDIVHDRYPLFSLEDPHNMVHDDVGGNGHMGDISYAGVDPIFYVHHANIDRFYAYWEHVYSQYWIGDKGWFDSSEGNYKPFEDNWGNYAEKRLDVLDENLELDPFRKEDSAYWASKDLRFLTKDAPKAKFYTYPPLPLKTRWGKDVIMDVSQEVDPETQFELANAMQVYFDLPALPIQSDLFAPFFGIFHASIGAALPAGHKALENYREILVAVELYKQAFGGSYQLELFAQNRPEAILGSVPVFSRKDPSVCAACMGRESAGVRVRGTIVIPHDVVVELLNAAGLNNANESDERVLTFLRSAFAARIITSGRDVIAEIDYGQRGTGPALFSSTLDDARTPSLSLLSAGAVVSTRNEGSHHYLTDVDNHGALLFETGWKTI